MLPGSGLALSVGEASSADELFTLETTLPPRHAVLELGRRVARTVSGEPVDWEGLPATDIDALALVLRQTWIGDAVSATANCPAPDCREPVDISFSAAAYLDHHRPRRARGATADDEPGWFRLTGAPVRFRSPLVADLLAALDTDGALAVLTERCIAPGELTRAQARRVDRALAALSPALQDELGGSCPACGQTVRLRFDPCPFVLAELRAEFAPIYGETHLLAVSYGWAEAAILRLPRQRRRRYAALAAQERAAA